LDNLDFHLRDQKLHIVAAPGAGKTTLGIEVIARLQRPTLILCPTNTIKNQWRERICTSFLQEKDYGIVSTAIRKPGFLTVTTYQALLAAFCGRVEEEEASITDENAEQEEVETDSIASSARFKQEKADEVITILKAANVSLLCFDEAHHLRKEWWKALTYLNEQLKPKQTLALTATPPYDADYGEWKRYQDLCGEIDEVISIPELVKNGDLCPHQDYVYFSFLKQHERELLDKYNQNVRTFIEMILNDVELLESLSKMKFFEAEDSDVETIFENPAFYVSVASLLNAKGYPISERFLELFDAEQSDLPKFDLQQASTFIKVFLEIETDEFQPFESKKNDYFNHAKRLGLVANKKVVLDESIKIRRLIANSLGKLDSVAQIVKLESAQLKEQLRMVILTDYIRMDDTNCQSIGVVPIWRKLKDVETFPETALISIGVLCGSLILLPKKTVGRLYKLLSDNNIAEDAVNIGRFGDDDNYVRITPKESLRNHIVRIITEMFCAGDLTVLIGTQALLGEGWDAPAINSLILSNTVSSYMLSNQMRGRAIRIDKHNPDKVSNIWHLATIDFPDKNDFSKFGTVSDNDLEDFKIYTSDLVQLDTRFKGFEAPSCYGNHEIMSGIERILDDPSLREVALKKRVEKLKDNTLKLAKNRELIRQWWNDALYLGYGQNKETNLSTGVEVPRLTTKSLLFYGYKSMVLSFLATVLVFYYFLLRIIPFFFLTTLALVVVAIFLGIMSAKYLKTGTVEGVLKQVSIVILETMSSQGLIKSSIKNVGLHVTEVQGSVFVSCSNLPAEENNLFIQALQELLDPIDNPRYLLIKHSKFLGRVKQTDYFAVPSILSTKKKSVEIFQKLWKKYIGECEIVYTRNLDGRKVLLKARKNASSTMKRKRSKRLSKWQ
jgi:superfamily II DNA or RNA helicase